MHHMFAVGLDVDKFVFTIKILLYAGNSNISSPLVFIALGKIYYPLSLCTVGKVGKKQFILPGQSAGNFSFSSKATATTQNNYTSYTNLPFISEHVPMYNCIL